MAEHKKPKSGSIVWTDLTVKDANKVRDFYSKVVGWESTDHDMGDYNDYSINIPEGGDTVAGICHARGSNSKIPPQWMIYVQVDSVEESAKQCLDLGGKVIDGPRKMGDNDFCIIQDPEGAVMALMS